MIDKQIIHIRVYIAYVCVSHMYAYIVGMYIYISYMHTYDISMVVNAIDDNEQGQRYGGWKRPLQTGGQRRPMVR